MPFLPENPVAQAENQASEAEQRVVRLRALLNELRRSSRPYAADMARELLIILQQNLRVAHSRLRTERERRISGMEMTPPHSGASEFSSTDTACALHSE